ncbi:hypothetical protein LSCM1_04459 [Leishmania martiniquensis]|uniref:ABC transporter domain-containing protein n=1 Tax=Leishmania martiniquensis TaxID=1580590 RepID=A0A836KPX2_9TRYP|nr:hypothetical protein LSCM1_04459 [Leishmania martiniquensis]
MSAAAAVKTPAAVGKSSAPLGVFKKSGDVSCTTSDEVQQSRDDLGHGAPFSEKTRLTMLQSEPVVLRLRHIGKSYPIAGSEERVVALKDITLAEAEDLDGAAAAAQKGPPKRPLAHGDLPPPFGPVRRGEFVMIRGPSGGGKTTLLNIIGSIDSCSEGTIELNGRLIDKSTKESVLADIRLTTLGFAFQTFNLIATMTAVENVELPMTLLGKLSPKEMRLRSRQLLTLVGLRNRINHLPSELSGGEQQRVTIARSLANSPSLLLLDEPTGDLDTANTIEVMDLLMRINRRTKATCIMVTHNPDIECYADRILYVSDGRFVKEVFNSLPACLNLDAYVKFLAAKEKAMVGFSEHASNECDSEQDAIASTAGGTVDKDDKCYAPLACTSVTTIGSVPEVAPAASSCRPQATAMMPSGNKVSQSLADSTHYRGASVPSAAASSLQQREAEGSRH